VIDFWKLVKDFKQGDTVQRYAPGQGGYSLSPFTGRVTAVHRGLGVLDVQWPYANERMSPDEVVRVNPKLVEWLPPEFDQSYDSYDIQKAREKWASSSSPWAGSKLPPGFYKNVAMSWAKGASEMGAYDEAWHQYAAQGVDDESLRTEIQKFYQVGERLRDLRITQHVAKSAAYWVAQNRQYRVTAEEVQHGKPRCPKCATSMRRTTYKMKEGSRVRLFACPRDLFLLKSDAILGPLGEPMGW
jgi:hypothetical protein